MPVGWTLRDSILEVIVENPPVNALSKVERQGLIDAIERANLDHRITGVVILGAGDTFIAGADIREFGAPSVAPTLPEVTEAIEGCAKPVVAAMAGQALGGGLEIALACHWRIATQTARFGLPESTLGLVPGAGGTQRLPRLIDPQKAGAIIARGRPMGSAEALEAGMIDEIAALELLIDRARLAASRLSPEILATRRTSSLPSRRFDEDAFAMLRGEVARGSRGAEAPLVALDLVELASKTAFAEGAAREREEFLRLRDSDQATALRHIFFAERTAAKLPAEFAAARASEVTCVGVIGAGTMGTGIAMSMAEAGLDVTVLETSGPALARGLDGISANYQERVSRGRMPRATADAVRKRISGSTDYQSLAMADLIVEAAFEDMATKREIFLRLDAVARPGAILATNTSYLDVDEIAGVTKRPESVLGLHFFSPANIMRLLEVVRTRSVSPDVLMTALALAKRISKVPVISGVCNGFIGNRLLRAYVREAGLLLLEGASPDQVDRAMTDFGMALGPFAVADLSGIDIGYRARKAMSPGSYEPLATVVHDALVEHGELGRKSGRGFYVYDEGNGPFVSNPRVIELIQQMRLREGSIVRQISDSEIINRCLLAIVNEGGFVLADQIAARPGDIDVVYVNGYGFPRHRGGPMFWAARSQPDELAGLLNRLEAGRFGRWWKQSPFIGKLLNAG
jgi:3-hydroxyacyl-CoA dehydrogenase